MTPDAERLRATLAKAQAAAKLASDKKRQKLEHGGAFAPRKNQTIDSV